ncbi:hypothetical protein RI367_005094 [Sorochytrium milnesiophthora]
MKSFLVVLSVLALLSLTSAGSTPYLPPIGVDKYPLGIESVYNPATVPAPPAAGKRRVLWSRDIDFNSTAIRWTRLVFGPATFLNGGKGDGNGLTTDGDVIRVTSKLDKAEQYLDSVSIQHWSSSSAYFNGDRLSVELLSSRPNVNKDKKPSKVELTIAYTNTVEQGIPIPPPKSLCNAKDTRKPSSDLRAGRLWPIGCTGWAIDDAGSCFLTAGHCYDGQDSTWNQYVLQYNLPPSFDSNGDTVPTHPAPKDQYPVDVASIQHNLTTTDWAYFGVWPNSNTGKTPSQANHGVKFRLAPVSVKPKVGSNLRITGNGLDEADVPLSLTQQTATGRLVNYGKDGPTRVAYRIDTEGGNSGSPVQDIASGYAIAIHTNGGCDPSDPNSSNFGTLVSDAEVRRAIANPQGVCKVKKQ